MSVIAAPFLPLLTRVEDDGGRESSGPGVTGEDVVLRLLPGRGR